MFCQQLFGRSFPAAARVCRFGSKRGCSSSKQEEGFVDEYGDNVDFGPDDRPLYNRVVDNVKMFHRETKEALTKEKFEFEQIGDIRKEFTFENEEQLNRWQLVSDSSRRVGYSQCQLAVTPLGRALFTGVIDTRVPKTGQLDQAGFCNMTSKFMKMSFGRFHRFEWHNYTHLVIRCRGDGRSYMLVIGCRDIMDHTYGDAYGYPLYTRGGPFWQVSKIPFSKFLFMSGGVVQDQQSQLPKHNASTLGITVGAIDGPFQLEIDFIGVEQILSHREHFAYEMYRTPAGAAF